MVKEKEKGVSCRPDDFEAGGRLFQGRCIWRNSRFEEWTYPGTSITIPTFATDLESDGEIVATQHWSTGNLDDFIPSKDGEKLLPIGERKLSKSSNFHALIKSLADANYPDDKFPASSPEENIYVPASVFNGMECEMIRITAPERKGLQKKEKKYEDTVLLVDTIIQLPGEEDTKGKSVSKGKGGDEVTDKATQVIMEILGENPKGIQKMKLASEAFKKLKAEKVEQATINAVVQLIGGKDETFISSGPWTFEKGMISQS